MISQHPKSQNSRLECPDFMLALPLAVLIFLPRNMPLRSVHAKPGLCTTQTAQPCIQQSNATHAAYSSGDLGKCNAVGTTSALDTPSRG